MADGRLGGDAVSIADEVRSPETASGTRGAATQVGAADRAGASQGDPAGFDRTPPQDVAAEQSVLGGMMLSKDAIADVVEVLRPNDFYRPAHQTVYDAVIDLYGKGEPADAVTIAAVGTEAIRVCRYGAPPIRSSVPVRVSSAAMVTASAGSPFPYRSMTAS